MTHSRIGECCTHAPPATAANMSTTPKAVAERTAPGRIRYDHRPLSSAIGMGRVMLAPRGEGVPHTQPPPTQPPDHHEHDPDGGGAAGERPPLRGGDVGERAPAA